MKYYMMAYDMDPDRPDSLYYIGVHHFSIKDYKQAFDYFKKGFNF